MDQHRLTARASARPRVRAAQAADRLGWAANAEGIEAMNPTADHAVLHRVLRLLERIDSHQECGVLAFRIGTTGRGVVIVSHGRICLVADTARPYFAELLRQSDPELATLVFSVRERARQQNRRFGELILELDPLTVNKIRKLLRHHCVLSLVSMAETHLEDEIDFYALTSDSALRWAVDLGPAAADYSEHLTFSVIEIYEAAATLLDTLPIDRAAQVYSEFSAMSVLALLLWRDPANESISLPVAFKGPVSSMSELRRLVYAANRVLVSPTLRAAGVTPQVLLFGTTWNDVVCVHGVSRMALICAAEVGKRVQLANRSLR